MLLTSYPFVIYPAVPNDPLRSILLPLPTEEPKPKIVRLKRNFRALGEIKHISFSSVHFLARLVRNVKAAVDDNLHLVVCVLVDEGSACGDSWKVSPSFLFLFLCSWLILPLLFGKEEDLPFSRR